MVFDVKQYKKAYERDNYYKPTIRVLKDKKPILEQLQKQTKLSLSQIFIGAVEEKYDINLSSADNDNGDNK